jgi:hypothetical protein
MKDLILRYKYLLLVPIVIIVVMTLLLLAMSGGPQVGGFVYQLH